jgi:hypothetical protein
MLPEQDEGVCDVHAANPIDLDKGWQALRKNW